MGRFPAAPSVCQGPIDSPVKVARRPHRTHDCAVAVDRAVQQARDGRQLPLSTEQFRLRMPDGAMPAPHTQQALHPHPLVGTLMRTISGSSRAAGPSTNRAVEVLSITSPGGAADSIRCAIPTCSSTAA